MDIVEKNYSEYFYKYLDSTINFSKYDEKVNKSALYFNISNDIKRNIASDYFSVLNSFYVEKLSLDDKKLLKTRGYEIVKKTYKEVLKKENQSMIMYNPPMPEHNVKNGTLAIEFVYGKNIFIISDEEYSKVIKKQKAFIEKILQEMKQEIMEKLGLECVIFVSKRMRKNG